MSLGRKIIFVICLIVFVGSAGMLLNYFLTGMREQSSLEDLAKLKAERDDLKTDKGTVIGKYVDLYEANSDIIGWIQVEDTKIDYPIMWTPDDGFARFGSFVCLLLAVRRRVACRFAHALAAEGEKPVGQPYVRRASIDLATWHVRVRHNGRFPALRA